jgi:hypothetical protein
MDASNAQRHAFPVEAAATVTPDRFRRYEIAPTTLLCTLKPTTDQARFFARDRIAAAEDAGSKPGKVIGSASSVNDCRLSKRAKVKVRVPNRVGITGGIVAGAKDDTIPQWGRDDVLARRRTIGSRKSRKQTAKSMRAGR